MAESESRYMLIFKEAARIFSKVAVPFYSSTGSVAEFCLHQIVTKACYG